MTTPAKRLLQQVAQLNASPPVEDIALLSSDSPFEVNAMLFGPCNTPYAHGAFRIRLTYGSDYPAAPPTGLFLTKIHHPNVSSRGEICVNTLKRDWRAGVTVAHILTIVKCLLINPGPDSALNEDAGRQLLDSFEEFAKVARMHTSVHAIKIDRAIQEVEAAGGKKPMISCSAVKVLGDGDVNQAMPPTTTTRTHEGDDEQGAAKRIKMGAEAKKKADAKKKTLKRL